MERQVPVMVLVTLQRSCARLIRCGADMALKQGLPLQVVHVANREKNGPYPINPQILDELYALAGEAGAEMCVLASGVPVNAIAEYALEHGIGHIVMGDGENAHGIAQTLSGLLPGVQVLIIDNA